MPILITDYNWSQTDHEVIIRIPIKGIHYHPTVDIFTYETFIKINCSPFYCEIFLLHSIDEKKSRCKILENEAKFVLVKQKSEMWDNLELRCPKQNQLNEKKQITESAQLINEKEVEQRWQDKCELKRNEIHKEVDREAKIRKEIEKIKELEVMKKMDDMENKKNEGTTSNTVLDGSTQLKIPPKTDKTKTVSNVNGVRKRGNITVTFSSRQFPTPQRESQEPAEQEWLMKQHEARKSIGFVEEDLRPEERNPQWLKEKGDDFFRKKNYLAAISAYSSGIKLSPKYYELYLNRAAVHFQLENFRKCVEDCSSAFDLITPAVPANAKARAVCLARRGGALCKIGMIRQGYDEIVEAIKLNPDDQTLRHDAEMIRCKLEQF